MCASCSSLADGMWSELAVLEQTAPSRTPVSMESAWTEEGDEEPGLKPQHEGWAGNFEG